MKRTRSLELGTGLFIILGLVALGFLVTQTTNLETYQQREGYRLTARFLNIGSLNERAPVTLSGVTIGRVTNVRLDPERLEAVVSMRIDRNVDTLPTDTSASILTAGLLGEQYIGLEPGGQIETLEDGDEIVHTQSAIVLEDLIGKYLVNSGSGDSS